MKFFYTFCSLLYAIVLTAQQKSSPAGIYILQGQMEMASGFKLDSNGRFEFFFSYGALDRQGSGTWQKKGDTLWLNSDSEANDGFVLDSSKKIAGNKLLVQIAGAPPQLMPNIVAVVSAKGKEYRDPASEEGVILFPVAQADSITLIFQWCPDKAARFLVASANHNHFSFRMLPSIANVSFKASAMAVTSTEIKGVLPFLGDRVLTFQKQENE